MRLMLLIASVVVLMTASGCIFPGHRGGGDYYRERGEYRGRGDWRGHREYYGPRGYPEHSDYRRYPEPGVDVRIHAE